MSMPPCYQPVRRVAPQVRLPEVWRHPFRMGKQPFFPTPPGQDHHHPFFVLWLVKPVHHRMVLRIDGQHGEAVGVLTLLARPGGPKSGNTHW